VQLPQVMDGGVELPLAAAAPEAAHAEAVGALPVSFICPNTGSTAAPRWRCQRASESPQFGARKIPHFGGRGDQP
jgi:hypothetical protein